MRLIKGFLFLRSLSPRLTARAQMRIIHEPTEDTVRRARELWEEIQRGDSSHLSN